MKFLLSVAVALSCWLANSALAVTNIVTISGTSKYLFLPSNIVIRTMDTIRWTNMTTTQHDATHTPSSGAPLWQSGTFTTPNTFSFTFTNVGYYPYKCLFHVVSHPEQNGMVSVVSLSVTNPASNAIMGANAPFSISASASTNVASVQFFTNGVNAGLDNSTPFSVALNGLPIGTYTTATKVTDTRGNTNTFAGPTFSVANITISELATANGGVSFNVHGGSFGQRCIIYASTNLANPAGWVAVSTNTFPNTLCPTCPFVTFQEAAIAGKPPRFFRAQVVP